MQRSAWLWPILLLLSVLATWVVTAVWPAFVLRPLVILWFLAVCPGMAWIRFLRLREPIAEWTLAVATSLVLDALVASVQVYTHHWSPSLTLNILVEICIIGVFGQQLVLLLSQILRKQHMSNNFNVD